MNEPQEEDPAAVVDLLPPLRGPGEQVRRLLHWDICHAVLNQQQQQPPLAPEASLPPRMRSATFESHMSVGSGSHQSDDLLDQVIQNARSAWDHLVHPGNTCLPTSPECAKGSKVRPHPGGEDDSGVPREVFPSSDHTSQSNTTAGTVQQQQNPEASSSEDDQVRFHVVVTEPGTSRATRVFHGLELFLLAVFLLGMTLHLLRQSGGVELAFVLERKKEL